MASRRNALVRPVSTGELDQWLIVEAATEDTDAEGQPVKTWARFASDWAKAEYLSGRELERAQKISAEITIEFVMRYRREDHASAITTSMRIVWRGFVWNVLDVRPNEDKQFMTVMCSKVE